MQARLKNVLGSYPGPFWVLMAGTFVDRLGTNLVIPFLAIYMVQRFQIPYAQVAIVYTVWAVSGAVGNVLAGALADRFGRRLTLILGLALGGTARIGLGLAPDLQMLYIAAGFGGFFGAIGWPAQLAMTADLLGPERRADGFGIQRVVINSTFAIGPLAGAMLAPVLGYPMLFIMDAFTSYIVAFVIYARLPETKQASLDARPETFAQTLLGYGRVLRDRAFLAFILISILLVSAFMQMSTTLPLFLVGTRGVSEAFFGSLITLNATMVVFLQIPFSRWSSTRPIPLIMLLGAGLYLLGFGSFGWTFTRIGYILGMVLATLGEMLVIPGGQALTAMMAPADMRARYVAVERFNWIIAQSLAPLAAGLIMDSYDARWVWHGASILCAISMIGFWLLHHRTRERLSGTAPQRLPAFANTQPTPSDNG